MAKPIYNEKTKTWSIRATIVDNNGVRHREMKSGFLTEKNAVDWEKDYKNQQSYSKNISLYDVFKQMIWDKQNKDHLKIRTIASYEQYIDYIKKDIPNIPITDLNVKYIEKALQKNISLTRKCEWYRQLLSMVVNYAKQKGFVPESFNPFANISWVNYAPKEAKFAYNDELAPFVEFIKQNYPIIYAPVLLCSVYGLRPSEALCLEYEDIKANQLYIHKTFEYVRTKNMTIKNIRLSTKNGVSEKYYIDDKLIEQLQYYKTISKIESKYICINTDGEVMLLRKFESELKRAINSYREAGNTISDLTPYSLRHSFGNIAKRNGVDIYTIKDLMRHKSVRTTEKNYLKTDKELNKRATTAITNSLLNEKKVVNILDIL